MSRRAPRPICPAPAVRPRYPRVGAVWGAFAAGGLAAVLGPQPAVPDCALPASKGGAEAATAVPGAAVSGKKPGDRKPTPHAALPGKRMPALPVPGEAAPVRPPVEGKLGGVVAPVEPPVVAPQGGPARVMPPPPPPGRAAPTTPARTPTKKPDPVQVDGDMAHVGPVRYIHPHGPDEPCHAPGTGRLVVRFT